MYSYVFIETFKKLYLMNIQYHDTYISIYRYIPTENLLWYIFFSSANTKQLFKFFNSIQC